MAIKFFKKRNKGKAAAAAEDEGIASDKAATNDEAYYYAGLIVTTIAVSPKDAADGSKVTFNEKDGNGEDAVFLKEIKMTSDGVFEATKVSVEEAKEIANNGFGAKTSTPLFIVHGFDVEPSSSLGYNFGNFKGDKKYYPVTVVWASEGNKALYFEDQNENALGAGRALNALVNFIPNETFPRKSLLMHSMGNHAVFNGACANGTPDVQFENIFMVAAVSPL
jgi:esterase/lipase superfamily enzyme